MSTSTFQCQSCGKDTSIAGASCAACGAAVPCPRCGWQPAEADEPARNRFGEFLVTEGVISEEQLVAALDQQLGQQEHFGQIAVSHGLLTAQQLLAVLHAQLVRRGRFGEIAIELGFLKEADVERVLELQRKGRPLIGEILVQMDLLDRPELERQLEAFLGSGTS